MSNHDLRPFCVVCGCQLPSMPRADALAKGAAVEIEGLTYYRCIGRHAHDEVIEAIRAVPGFRRAGGLK